MAVPAAGSAVAPVLVPRIGSAAASRRLRLVRAGWGTIAAAPVTSTVVAGLVGVLTLVSSGLIDPDELQRWASTNLVNLYSHPISALVLSAFVLIGPSAAGIAVAAVVCGLFERRAGARRLLAVAAAGQVIPSLISEGAVRLAIHTGGESRAAAVRFDVGISYVTFSVAAALTRYVPARWRRVALVAGIAATAVQFAATHDMTASGHALAYAVGLLSWPFLEQPDRSPISSPRGRRWALSALVVMGLVGLLAVYLPLAAFGLHPAHAATVVTGSGWPAIP